MGWGFGWGWGGGSKDKVDNKVSEFDKDIATDIEIPPTVSSTFPVSPTPPVSSVPPSAASQPGSVGRQQGKVVKLKQSEVPEGAYWLKPDTVAKYYKEQIFRWKPDSDVRWLRYGSFFNVVSANFTGLAILVHFRRRFNLGKHGYLSSVAATLVAPALITIGATHYLQNDILLGSPCPTCVEVRGGIIQVLSSWGYQAIMVPISCIYLSRRYNTNLTAKQRFQPNILHVVKNRSTLVYSSFILIMLNFFVGYFAVYKQHEEMDNIIAKEAISRGRAYLDQLTE